MILGYGRGQVAELIKMVWGEDVVIDGVDLFLTEGVNGYNDLWHGSADRFLQKVCVKKYDYVVVDIYNGDKIPDFVFTEEFVKGLAQVTKKILGVNATFTEWEQWQIYQKYFDIDVFKRVNHQHGIEKVFMANPREIK